MGGMEMGKFVVEGFFPTSYSYEVEAEDSDDAIKKAMAKFKDNISLFGHSIETHYDEGEVTFINKKGE